MSNSKEISFSFQFSKLDIPDVEKSFVNMEFDIFLSGYEKFDFGQLRRGAFDQDACRLTLMTKTKEMSKALQIDLKAASRVVKLFATKFYLHGPRIREDSFIKMKIGEAELILTSVKFAEFMGFGKLGLKTQSSDLTPTRLVRMLLDSILDLVTREKMSTGLVGQIKTTLPVEYCTPIIMFDSKLLSKHANELLQLCYDFDKILNRDVTLPSSFTEMLFWNLGLIDKTRSEGLRKAFEARLSFRSKKEKVNKEITRLETQLSMKKENDELKELKEKLAKLKEQAAAEGSSEVVSDEESEEEEKMAEKKKKKKGGK